MSATAITLTQDRAVARQIGRSMTPIYFDGCFGWLHPNRRPGGGDIAILLCPGLNRDALDAHYPLRLLADACAAAGYPTMRFDYPGLGDSGDIPGAEPWSAWLRSVQQAADWLRAATGARRLVLCGLRFGALLATLGAEARDDVAGLLLLAPILRGHSYMRQLAIEAQLLGGPGAVAGGALEFQELHFGAATVALIGDADLRRAELKAGLVVQVHSQSPSGLLAACAQAWTERGAEVTCDGFDGLEPLLHHNVQGEGQAPDFTALLDRITGALPARPAISVPTLVSRQTLSQADWSETPLRFGAEHRLFGMLCRPLCPRTDRVVIIASTGVDPHVGFARFGVGFARHLAASGIASLRVDFSGLGDSLNVAGSELRVSSIFETDRTVDLSAAIDALEHLGYSRFAVQGLCSGGFHGLHAALADSRIGMLLLINMPVFTWCAGDSIDFVGHKHAPSGYLVKLGTRDTYRRLLTGGIDVRGIVAAQAERFGERLRHGGRRAAARCGLRVARSFPERALRTLSDRGTRILFLYGEGDGGLDVLEQNFSRRGVGLRAFDGVSLQVVAGWDHALSGHAMRGDAAARMRDFILADSQCAARQQQ